MKKKIFILSAFVYLFLIAAVVFPQVGNPGEVDDAHKIVYKNPLKGLCCPDDDVRLDCVFVLGELKYKKAVIPLMRMLREDPCEAVRIVAAQSLIKIGDPQGVYLVSRTKDFNDFEKVRKYADKFYSTYLFEQSIAKNREDFAEDILAAMEADK